MKDTLSVIKSEYDKEISEYVDDLYLAYDPVTEARLKEDIKKMYKTLKRIPTVGYILDMVETSNYDTFHGITHINLKYKQGDVLCSSEEGFEKECGTIGYHVCEECCMLDDCYDNVMCNNVQWELGDYTFPLHLSNLLYSVLTDGDLCVYIDRSDLFHYSDLVSSYEYGNRFILNEFYGNGNEKDIIINHAQGIMFDDLFDRNEDGSCYNYGNFILMTDPFERKRREDYFLEGGK